MSKKKEKAQPAPSGFNLDDVVKSLAEQTEMKEENITKELNELKGQGYSEMGAVVTWKSQHKNLLGTRREYPVRVLGKDRIRTQDVAQGRSQRVTNIYFLTMDETNLITTKDATLWGDRVELADEFELNKCYMVKGKERGGRLGYLSSPTPSEDIIPPLKDLPEHNVHFAKPGQIMDYVDKLDLFHGWVGKLIRGSKGSGPVIGFELSDAESYPVTFWGGERFGPLPPDLKSAIANLSEGDEVLVYAYISLSRKSGEPQGNVKGVFILGENKIPRGHST
jgi:hypothetical protein